MGRVIVNAHNGVGWYPRGQERLRQSLQGHPEALCLYNDFPNDLFSKSNGYNVKPSALYEAAKTYSQLLWLDCSCWVIKDLQPIWDIVDSQGYYFINSDFNCSTYCNDKSLEYFGITRDEAENIAMISSGCFAIDLKTEKGALIYQIFIQSAIDNIFDNGTGSQDPRFIAHRHDQSALSIILHKLGCSIENPDLAQYNPQIGTPDDSVLILMQGM
jgi:hypothetical protein